MKTKIRKCPLCKSKLTDVGCYKVVCSNKNCCNSLVGMEEGYLDKEL